MTAPGNDFSSALSAWAAGVTLVTIADGRDDIGATVSGFTPVSLDPPLVLVSLIAGSYPAEVLSRPSLPAAQFAVTLLASSQKLLAGQFAAAGRPSARRILDDAPHTRGAESGALIPLGGLAALECSVARRVPAGDHLLVISAVTSVAYVAEDGRPADPLPRPLPGALDTRFCQTPIVWLERRFDPTDFRETTMTMDRMNVRPGRVRRTSSTTSISSTPAATKRKTTMAAAGVAARGLPERVALRWRWGLAARTRITALVGVAVDLADLVDLALGRLEGVDCERPAAELAYRLKLIPGLLAQIHAILPRLNPTRAGAAHLPGRPPRHRGRPGVPLRLPVGLRRLRHPRPATRVRASSGRCCRTACRACATGSAGRSPSRLPVVAVDDLVEGAAVRALDRRQRPVGRIAQRDQVRAELVVGEAEQAARHVLVARRPRGRCRCRGRPRRA